MEYGDVIQTKVPAPFSGDRTEGILAKMAKYPEVEITVIKNKSSLDHKHSENSTQVNGDAEKGHSDEQDEYTSDEELLIIDESPAGDTTQPSADDLKAQSPCGRANFKGFKKQHVELTGITLLKLIKDLEHSLRAGEPGRSSSDYKCDIAEESETKGESSSALSDTVIFPIHRSNTGSKLRDDDTCHTDQKYHFSRKLLNDVHFINENKRADFRKHKQPTQAGSKVSSKKPIKKRPSQKLTEYAQYLGLQPAVKFKCVKCSESSFPSLTALNDHQRQCLVQPAAPKPAPAPAAATSSAAPSTNFRVTRKVFLCSSCGTYYENCNLFLHMREVHKRYICLYCLGMFSFPEKLSHHLMTKHNCNPSKYSSANEFLNSNTESCYLICCHCERVFSERDNFFDHVCLEKRAAAAAADKPNRVGTDQAPAAQPSKPSKAASQKGADKRAKSTKNNTKSFAHVEHVTADSPATHLASPEPEQEANVAEHFLADIIKSNSRSEPETAPDKTATNEPDLASHKDKEGIKSPSMECITKVDETVNAKVSLCEESTGTDVMAGDAKLTADAEKATESESERMVCSDNENIEDNQRDNMERMSEKSSDSVTQMADGFDDNSETETVDNNNFEQKDDENDDNHDNEPISEKKNDAMETSTIEKSPSIETEESKQTDEKADLKETTNDTAETRKVPKVTLKLPLQGLLYSENESDDSEKLTMEIEENADSDADGDESQNDSLKIVNDFEKAVNGYDENEDENTDVMHSEEEYYQVAGEEVPVVELELEQPLDKFQIGPLLKTCLEATVPTCVYCNHARKIAVNGKQLGLHAMAEHRFAATVNSITAEELIPENFVARIKESLGELESSYFSLEEKSADEAKDEGEEDSSAPSFKRVYECFQCRYATSIHKELYLHNRKMHAKTILLCIMCKSNFYSYSELICHLCPGSYILNSEMKFRCCMCDSNDLPSAFRLMVHLRKRHHTCDVCLEGCHNQSKLSNHVWKHKLHHLCYRCGIAYRNKPDITKHLFWKHGTESVLCKKCLQKKWPHVYHFCIPPSSFACEECNLSFSKAVYLKVHKRLHSNEKPHACTVENCTESFISKKLLLKHERRHQEPESETLENPENKDELEKENDESNIDNVDNNMSSEDNKQEKSEKNPSSPEKDEQKQKNLIDVYNLPALNLSESDSDDSEDEKPKTSPAQPPADETKPTDANLTDIIPATTDQATLEEEQKPIPILDGIWDNFKNYQATIEKRDNLTSELINPAERTESEEMPSAMEIKDEVDTPDLALILAEHDYCVVYEKTEVGEAEAVDNIKVEASTDMDHDYCTVAKNEAPNATLEPPTATQSEERPATPQDSSDKKKSKPPKKKTKHGSSSSSDSSSDSDSSSCTCGSNCSCSSSSGSSSSSSSSSDSDSSSSEGKRRIAARRERRKERVKRKKESETSQAASNNSAVDVVDTENAPAPVPLIELPIQESDLDTDETETDEDFYDEHPQRLANKLLAEKRNQLAILASVAPVSNGTIIECSRPSTPSIPEEVSTSKKKVKSKKRKKKSRSSTPKQELADHNIPSYLNHQSPLAAQPSVPAVAAVAPPVQPLASHHPAVTTPKPEPPKPFAHNAGSGSETDSNVRSSKRKRVPNKFYGYSSDEEANEKPAAAPTLKWRKLDVPAGAGHVTGSPHLVPPITIKSVPSPAPAPVTEPAHRAPIIRHAAADSGDSDEDEVRRSRTKSSSDSSDSVHNDSDSDGGQLHISQPGEYALAPHQAEQRTNENLYCYCQCPYDEVSEMIACDGKDCAIEWFHFECVGIMVPPKGKWYCPDCRKKMQMQRSEALQT